MKTLKNKIYIDATGGIYNHSCIHIRSIFCIFAICLYFQLWQAIIKKDFIIFEFIFIRFVLLIFGFNTVLLHFE